MGYENIVDADIRLSILQILAQDADYAINDAVLHSALDRVGHRISLDKMRSEVSWLEEQRLLEAENTGVGEMLVVRLSARGMDVAQGRAVTPGVRRPRPGELG